MKSFSFLIRHIYWWRIIDNYQLIITSKMLTCQYLIIMVNPVFGCRRAIPFQRNHMDSLIPLNSQVMMKQEVEHSWDQKAQLMDKQGHGWAKLRRHNQFQRGWNRNHWYISFVTSERMLLNPNSSKLRRDNINEVKI